MGNLCYVFVMEHVTQILRARGWTQGDLALAMGADPSAVNHWLSGRRSPSLANLTAMADALQCSIDALLGRGEAHDETLMQVLLPVCRACILGQGYVCHTPGCVFIRRDVLGPVCEALGATGAESVQGVLLAAIQRRYGPAPTPTNGAQDDTIAPINAERRCSECDDLVSLCECN